MDEINLDNLDDIQNQAENKLKVKNRFKELSEQVITEKSRNETLAKEKAEADRKATDALKEVEFYKGFSANVGKYPQATQYHDTILEKVKNGYTPEDAILAVLAKEGKLTQAPAAPQAPVQPAYSPEGGSAPTMVEGTKSISDMTPQEKLAALSEADKRGELVGAFRQ